MSNVFNTVSMIGLGYIGLPTASVLAGRGVSVIGVDINQHAVDTINQGRIHIVEPDLDVLVHEVVRVGKLRATTKPEPADAFLIAVPTPFKGDHEPDLIYVEAASRSIAPVLKKGDLVILESTSPVGTTEKMSEWLAESRPELTFPHQAGEKSDISIAYCPERVLPGRVIQELVENDRVVGGMTPRCATRASALYKMFVEGECIITNARTAEMCKLTENSFRDVNIAFANELSLICDELGINVWELIRLANHHPRVNILQPGPGVGGHCIAVDPWFIVDKSPKTARLIRMAREVNDSKPHYVLEKVRGAAEKIKTPKIACLGLAFKADIDDLRESPSLEIVQKLKEMNLGELYVVEPHVAELPDSLKSNNVIFTNMHDAIERADIVLLLVNHQVFKDIGINALIGKVLIDTRGLWESM
jgi:UDP-N-acetyl-D-mannosaminuronic acid dehydrogenase